MGVENALTGDTSDFCTSTRVQYMHGDMGGSNQGSETEEAIKLEKDTP